MAACQAAGFSPVPLLELSDPAAVRGLVHAGLGVSLVPASWLALPGPAVRAVELPEPGLRHRVALLAPATGLTPAAEAAREALPAALAS
jgi:DNA-binding transcriptional LysR family regulator